MLDSTRPTIAVRNVMLVLVLTVPGIVQASSFRVLCCETEALQARIDLIQQAEHSIDLACYGIDTGEVPLALIELMRQAAGRGVRVRIVYDDLKSRVPEDLERYLRRCGVQFRVYHPLRQWNLARLNWRMHSKLLVVDSEQAIIGGRNLANEYFRFGCRRSFLDCDAFVAGQVARDSQAYFDWLWTSTKVARHPNNDLCGFDMLDRKRSGSDAWREAWRNADACNCYQPLLSKALATVVSCCGVQLNTGKDWLANAIHNTPVCLLRDCRLDKSHRRVQQQVVQLMDRATCSLLIESPYPAFDKELRSAITRARRRGVHVTILTNSLQSTDHLNVYAAYQNQKRSLLREGVRLREYCGKKILHAKTMIVDDKTWMLGSYNFDARSNRFNLELCLMGHDPAAARALRSNVQSRLVRSVPISNGKAVLPVGNNASLHRRAWIALQRLVVELYRPYL